MTPLKGSAVLLAKGNGAIVVSQTKFLFHPRAQYLPEKGGCDHLSRKQMHKDKKSTREKVIEAENDPDLYQYEDRRSNQSHKFEQMKSK